ncbi:MAG: right-handed parallel beta-helix repeat-containing protein [Clostridia bacterium]|nr:right-handed parallel beta-helix repeat-containing protein [Clostridia bacterium]
MNKRFTAAAAVICSAIQIITSSSAGAMETSGQRMGTVQGETGWYYMINNKNIYHYMPKFTSNVKATWQSGHDYPYVDENVFYPSDSWNAVKKWTAPYDCYVSVKGSVSVGERSENGVKAQIKKENDVLWERELKGETADASLEELMLNKGESLYFAVDSIGNMNGDKTVWNPEITYRSIYGKPDEMLFTAMDAATLSGNVIIAENKIQNFSSDSVFVIKNAELYDGYKTLGVKLQAGYTGDTFEVRLDSPSGRKISEFVVCNTDGEEEYQYSEFDETVNDMHDLYFVSVKGSSIAKISEIALLDRETYGATTGFITEEAEKAQIGGKAVVCNLNNYDVPQVSGDSRDGNNYNYRQKAVQAASDKAYVDLASANDYVEFTVPKDSNRIVMRYTIPANSTGSVSLYVNDELRQRTELTSDYNYDTDSYYMRSFDDKLIAMDLSAGDRLKIKKDESDTGAYCGIDLVDFEMVDKPVEWNEEWISIEDYGAVANDDKDDTSAIEQALRDAKLMKQPVYIPAGRFIQTKRVEVPDGVNIYGAGMWYSEIYCPTRSYGKGEWGGKIGYYLKTNTEIRDLMISGNSRYRGDSGIAIMGKELGDGEFCHIDKVWFRNMTVGMGWTNWSHSIIENCRFTGLYADALHFGDGPQQSNTAVNNYIRGCGDDGVAVVTRKDYTEDKGLKASDITAQFNTVRAAYWGRGMSIVGGSNVKYTNNIIDGSVNAGLMVSAELLTPSYSVKNDKIRVQRNIIKHTSNRLFHHAGMHFDLSYNGLFDARFEMNCITDNASSGIWVDNTAYGDDGKTEFTLNVLERNGWSPQYRNENSQFNPILRDNYGF